jgi:hypothetical protein
MTSGAPRDSGTAPGGAGLWARLLAGQVTEVLVLSHRGLGSDLPQTLGLEVIHDAYVYDTRGVPRSPQERVELAGQLAAEPRWLAVGGPRYWVEPFAARAEAILVMPLLADAGSLAVDTAIAAAFDRISGLFRKREPEPERGLITDSIGPGADDRLGDGPMTNSQQARYYQRMRGYLTAAYPRKTFQISLEDRHLLRSVRASRREGSG